MPLCTRRSLIAGTLASAAVSRMRAQARDYWNDWPQFIADKVGKARVRRMAALARIHTEEQVRARGEAIRAAVWQLIGGPLEKTPLAPRVTGILQRSGYRVEKIVFESQPGVYVTAHLYVPAGKPPFPGILAPLGHASEGKLYRPYQTVFQNLARQGHMVLAFDPLGQGERMQYLDASGRPLLGPTREHDQAGRPLLLLGASFALYRAWDGIRALDYLLTRPEVDRRRIGCTGHSGGGTMTMYLCALEPRIHTAVEVEGHSENFASAHFEAPGPYADAEQNLIGSLAKDLDRGDLLWAFAPRPLLICYTPLDAGTTYSPGYVAGTQEIFAELQQPYGISNAKDKVQIYASPVPHDFDFFTRRRTYEWFERWLRPAGGSVEEVPFEDASASELNCTPTGQVLTSLGGRSVVQVNTDRLRSLSQARVRKSPEEMRRSLIRVLALPSARSPLRARTVSSNRRPGVIIEEVEFQSEPGMRIPGWLVRPEISVARLPVLIHLSEHGRDGLLGDDSFLAEILGRGYAVCAVDLRGTGDTRPRFPSAGPDFYDRGMAEPYAWAGLVLGRPVLGQRVWDFLRCVDYVATRAELDRARIRVMGTRGAGLVALMGAALDERVGAVLLDHTLADYRSVVEAQEYNVDLASMPFGILKEFDLPDIAAVLGARLTVFAGPEENRPEVLRSWLG